MKCLCLSGCLVYEHYLHWTIACYISLQNQPNHHITLITDMYMLHTHKGTREKKSLQQTNNKKCIFFLSCCCFCWLHCIVICVHLQENTALHLHDVHPFFIYLQKQASNNDSSSASDQTHYACMMHQHYQKKQQRFTLWIMEQKRWTEMHYHNAYRLG